MPASRPATPALDAAFVRRTLFVLAVALAALLVWRLIHVFLLLFGAVLIAVLLRTLAEPIQRYARLPQRWAVMTALVTVLAVLGLTGWVFGREVGAQVSSLTSQLPAAWETAQSRLLTLPWGDRIVERLDGLAPRPAGASPETDAAAPQTQQPPAPAASTAASKPSAGGMEGDLLARARAFAASIFSGAAQLLLVLFAGIFLALNPQSYRDGVTRLAPNPAMRERIGRAFDVSGQGLRRWLLGQLISMALVGTAVGLGTWAIGLPSPLALGLFAGVLEFVPIVGPTLSAIPALLLALMDGPTTFLWTLALYVGIQQIEGNLIVPLVQKRMVSLPPVLALFAILSFGALFGAIGVLFATPLAVVAFLLVKALYLGDDVDNGREAGEAG